MPANNLPPANQLAEYERFEFAYEGESLCAYVDANHHVVQRLDLENRKPAIETRAQVQRKIFVFSDGVDPAEAGEEDLVEMTDPMRATIAELLAEQEIFMTEDEVLAHQKALTDEGEDEDEDDEVEEVLEDERYDGLDYNPDDDIKLNSDLDDSGGGERESLGENGPKMHDERDAV